MLTLLFTLCVSLTSKAANSAHPSPPPVRVVFLGGEWSVGNWIKAEDSTASRFHHHLEKFLNKKVDFRSYKVTDPTSLPALVQAVLAEKRADYVFYFVDHSGIPVSVATKHLAPWNAPPNTFSHFLSDRIGAIRLGTDMKKSPIPEDVILNPLSDIFRRSAGMAINYGAKFLVLWPGFPISAFSWTAEEPTSLPERLASYLNFINPTPGVSPERLMLHFRRNQMPVIANLQISRYFTSLRLNESADSTKATWSPEAADNVAKMLATSTVSVEF